MQVEQGEADENVEQDKPVAQVDLENRSNETNQTKRSSLDEAVAQVGLERVICFPAGTPRRKE